MTPLPQAFKPGDILIRKKPVLDFNVCLVLGATESHYELFWFDDDTATFWPILLVTDRFIHIKES